MYYRICERCGAHLDPDEQCDCWRLDQIELEMCERLKPRCGAYEMDSYAREGQEHDWDCI